MWRRWWIPVADSAARITPPPLVERRALDVATVGYAVLDEAGHVLYANERADELGLVRAGLIDRRIGEAVSRAVVHTDPVDVELGPQELPPDLIGPRRNPMSVQAVLRSMGDGLVLVSASDETETLRLEAVRRDFVANVSHELKTPVAAISLLAEAVTDAADDPESVERFSQRLVHESNRLSVLVNELIVLSRLQGADPLPDLSVVEADAVIAEAVARTATLAESAGIDLVTGEKTGLLVMGDRPMLLTALTNLMSNAVHYSPAGTSVSISCVLRETVVEISVTDRGIGIAPEHQQRVFERFFRVDQARSRATGGTGLGLAIVKHVAANHGGEARVWSKPGLGSTFTLRLPQYRPAPPVESSTPPAGRPGTERPTGAPRRHASSRGVQ
ncbi:two-component sensor histidine kinase [Nakamurella sp. YIM 132087]|uniref:Sensor-like histidine kinase SenX3 n=2 Tax=Nakamurella alba TaxID=2665158 RepID=A0A7K1FPT2_9ACTN|nr:two-component sensor histidine kinase [Nakamurella alba]